MLLAFIEIPHYFCARIIWTKAH